MAVSDVELSIYDDAEFADVDVGSLMRRGHPDIVDGDNHILREVQDVRGQAARPLRLIDVGSGSGDLVKLLVESIPGLTATAIEPAGGPATQARAKLEHLPAAHVFEGRFEDWSEPVDAIVSWGTHHHLSHGYLTHVAKLIGRSGVFIVGDEFSPEYLDDHDVARLARCTTLEVIDGYIFDSDKDIAAYRADGAVTTWARELENRRRRVLWDWYKFVGDFAIERGEWDVLLTELAIARNDLVTRYSGEHKTSPRLLERELKLSGLTIVKKFVVGDRRAGLQSFVIYTCRV